MQSLIHLYNTALAELGGEQLPLNVSPIESDAVGALCQNIFPHVLDTVLEAHDWSFARARAVLAQTPEPGAGREPETAYLFRYALPSDCVRPIRIAASRAGVAPFQGLDAESRSPEFVIEGEYLLCNLEQAALLYVARVAAPRRWPAYFADALIWKLASSLATARNNDKQQKQMCEQMYEYALARACARDRSMRNPRGQLSAWRAARGNQPRRARQGRW